jgi:hypothetical protein
MTFPNLVTPKAGAKHELVFNKLASVGSWFYNPWTKEIRYLPSGVRPEASSGAADTLNPAGGPVDNLASMVKAASSPEEPLGKLTGLVHEVFSLKVRPFVK